MPPTRSSAGLPSWAQTAGEPCHPLMTGRCLMHSQATRQAGVGGGVGRGGAGHSEGRRHCRKGPMVRTHPSAGAGAMPWGPSPCPLPADTAPCPEWPSNGPTRPCPGAYPCHPAVQAVCLQVIPPCTPPSRPAPTVSKAIRPTEPVLTRPSGASSSDQGTCGLLWPQAVAFGDLVSGTFHSSSIR